LSLARAEGYLRAEPPFRKNTNCIVQTTDAAPSLAGERHAHLRHHAQADGDTPNGDAWVKAEAFKLFPLYKKLRSH
jgi:hypothetical protein